MADIIRHSLEEFDIDLQGTVYVDPYLDNMYSHFTVPDKVYFVAIEDGIVLGGSGIAPLDDVNRDICELQRMFVLKAARGKGIGQQLMDKCLVAAKEMGFKKCYLETFADMQKAIALYERNNFRYMDAAMGNTGHFACKTWMLRDL
jgi:putative acetyltransferase